MTADPLTDPAPAPRPASKLQATRLVGRDLQMLQEVSDYLGTDHTEASRRSIRMAHWLVSLEQKGRTLLVRDDETGVTREVVLLP